MQLGFCEVCTVRFEGYKVCDCRQMRGRSCEAPPARLASMLWSNGKAATVKPCPSTPPAPIQIEERITALAQNPAWIDATPPAQPTQEQLDAFQQELG